MRQLILLLVLIFAAKTVTGTATYSSTIVPWLRRASKCTDIKKGDHVAMTYNGGTMATWKSGGAVQVVGFGAAADISHIADELEANVTKVVANYMAYAALKSDRSVVTWGEDTAGGDNAAAQAAIGGESVLELYSAPRSSAFAALLSNSRKLVTWGSSWVGGDSSAVETALSSGIVTMVFNVGAGAALKDDGSVHTWGSSYNGGDSSAVADHLLSNVTGVFASRIGFIVTKMDGTVVTWGGSGSNVHSLRPVEYFKSTKNVSAALHTDGSVTVLGDSNYGGNPGELANDLTSGVIQLVASSSGFAALKESGEVISWGWYSPARYPNLMNVTKLYASEGFLALHQNGTVTPFLHHDIFYRPTLPPVKNVIPLPFGVYQVVTHQTESTGTIQLIGSHRPAYQIVPCDILDISNVVATSDAFAGITNDGHVRTWGSSEYGGSSLMVEQQLQNSLVVNITATRGAFAALTDNASVIAWGLQRYGGDTSKVQHLISSGVKAVVSNEFAFAALKYDGSVVTWGYSERGGTQRTTITNATDIIGAKSYFAAFKADGSAVTWGRGCGDSASVADQLLSGVQKIVHSISGGSCAVLKTDTSVVTWGFSSSDTDYLSHLTSGVVEVVASYRGFAALKDDNTVIGWGYNEADSNTKFYNNVRKVVGGLYAFAVLHYDGSVSAWGSSSSGGIINAFTDELQSGVIDVISNPLRSSTFVAVKEGGRALSWGSYTSEVVDAQLQQNVTDVYCRSACAALKSNGQVVTWGHSTNGGDSSTVSGWLQDKVIALYSAAGTFAALRSDGVAVVWGGSSYYSAQWVSNGLTRSTDDVAYNVTEIIPLGFGGQGYTALAQTLAPPTPTPTSSPTQQPTAAPTIQPTPLRFKDGSTYTGELNRDNQMDGYGTIVFPNGNKFRGYFKRGLRSNTGEFIRSDGRKQVINWAEPQHAVKPGFAREAPPATYYLGCVADGPSRDLNHLAFVLNKEDTDSETNIIAECEDVCRQGAYWFFGVQEGTKCFCGNNYGRLEVHPGDPLFRDEKECDVACDGALSGTGLKCGGHWRNSVFRIGIQHLLS